MIGKKLAHYEILQQIGSGGMGQVYRARDTKLNREVAIKVLPAELATDPERVMRFEREAQAIAALQHPNIITIYAVEEEDGVRFLTMELVEGRTLNEVIPEGGLALDRFLEMAIPLADAIASAHDKGITHRDLKPANIMLGDDGRLRVLDFGLAKLFEEPAGPASDATVVVDDSTQVGKVLGTVAYMSPEQAEGKSVDHRSDIFSLGILMYEMATGQAPFQGDSGLSVMTAILRDDPVSITQLKGTLPVQLGRIVDHCLAKEPSRRFQSALDVRNELDSLRTEMTSGVGHVAVSAPKKSRTGLVAGLAAVAVAAVGLAFVMNRGGDEAASEPAAVETVRQDANALAVFPFQNLADPQDTERLGDILRELVITDLSGQDALKVLSSQRLTDVQKQLGREGESATDPGLATAVAQKAGASKVLSGSLSQLGSKYILTCQIVDVEDGTIVQSKRIDGEDLYTMVDQLTDDITAGLNIDPAAASGQFAEVAPKSIKEKTSSSLDAYRHYLEGIDHLDDAQFREAVASLKEAVRIDPRFGQAWYKLAIATWWEGRGNVAGAEEMEHFLAEKLYSSERERRMAEGMIDVIRRRWASALPVFQQLTQDYPDEKEAWYGLGEAQFHFPGNEGDPQSLASFQRAVALDPDFRLPYNHIFDLLAMTDGIDEAIELAEQRIAEDPEHNQWYRRRAYFYVRKGDEAKMRQSIDEALAVSETPADRRELYKLLAQGAQSRGRDDQRERYLKQALAADPEANDQTIAQGLIGTLQAQRKHGEADAMIRSELAKKPEDAGLRHQLLGTFLRARQHDEGLRTAKTYVAEDAQNPEWYASWVMMAIYKGDEAEAAKAIESAEQVMENVDVLRGFYESVAGSYQQVGDVVRARAFVDKALAVDPDNQYPSLLSTVAMLEYVKSDLEAAEEWFQRSLRANPRHQQSSFGMMALATERGDFEAANQYAQTALSTIPVEWLQPFVDAFLLIYEGKLDDADALIRGVRTKYSPAVQWNFLGNEPGGLSPGYAYLLNGHHDRAREVFEYMVSTPLGELDPAGYIGLGRTALFEAKTGPAKQAFERALQMDAAPDAALQGLAYTHLLDGDLELAEAAVQRLQAEGRHHEHTVGLMGYVRSAQRRYAQAHELAQAAMDLSPTLGNRELLAWTLVAGDLDVARGMREAELAANTHSSSLADVTRHLSFRALPGHTLGLGHYKQGDYAKAVQYLQKAAQEQPANTLLKEHLDLAIAEARKAP